MDKFLEFHRYVDTIERFVILLLIAAAFFLTFIINALFGKIIYLSETTLTVSLGIFVILLWTEFYSQKLRKEQAFIAGS